MFLIELGRFSRFGRHYHYSHLGRSIGRGSSWEAIVITSAVVMFAALIFYIYKNRKTKSKKHLILASLLMISIILLLLLALPFVFSGELAYFRN